MKKNDNVALSMFILVKRNMRIYLVDKMNVFFSVLAPLIVLLLYILFLGNMQVDSVMSMPEFAASGLKRADVQTLINNWMISGVMGVSCITVAINANVCMVRDREDGIRNDMLASPIKRWVIYVSYIISTLIITFCICLIVLLFSLVYLACTGGFFLGFIDVLAILGITVLACAASSLFVVLLCSAIKTVSSLSAVNGVFSTVIGFLIGAYLPFSMLPIGIQYLGCFVPGTYSTGLFKYFFMRGIVADFSSKIPPESGLVEQLTSQFSLELDFFGMKVSAGWMAFAVVMSVLLFAGIVLLLYTNKKTNLFTSEKRKKKKNDAN